MTKNRKKGSKGGRRNAPPPFPRAKRTKTTDSDESPKPKASVFETLLPAGVGAIVMAGAGGLLAREQWAPKRIALALGVAGAIAASQEKYQNLRAPGLSVFSAALSQFALLEWPGVKAEGGDDPPITPGDKTRRQASGVSNEQLTAAFERARKRLALDSDEHARYGAR